jgi:hypothetical protein
VFPSWCAAAEPSVGDMNDVALPGKFTPAGREVVAFVLAGMLRQPSGVGTAEDERVPTMIVLFAVVHIRPRKDHREWNSVLVDDHMPFGPQLSPISRVFPDFFPLFGAPRPCGCPESATATRSLSNRHTRAGSATTSFEIPLAWPSSENTDVWCCPRSTPAEASSTDNRCAEHKESRPESCAAPPEACLRVSFLAWVQECIP